MTQSDTQTPSACPDPRLAARVPRYTSYPPANHFKPQDGDRQMRHWLGALDPAKPISLYVHIPFCRRLCWFCACRTQGTKTAAPVTSYIDFLVSEMALVRDTMVGGIEVGHLHWGGGTPTLLTPDQMQRLGRALRAAFPMKAGAAFAVEIDPTEIDDARLDTLAELGLSRASVGVQDFEPRIQEAIGRLQGPDITLKVMRGLRARGVSSLNIDLLYGLPYQTPESLAETLKTVIALGPDRVALYGYAHVPWMARRQRLIPEDKLPQPPQRQVLADTARHILTSLGYVPIGIDHFAKPGDCLAQAAATGALRRNFQGYTTDTYETLIGLGASAVSRFPQGYTQNASRTGEWAGHLTQARLPTARGHAHSNADRLRGKVIERIMCQFEVDIAATAAALDMDAALLDPELDRLLRLFPDAVERDGRQIRLRHDDGRYARVVAAVFDAYILRRLQAYSLAV